MTDSNPAPPAEQVQASLAGLRGRQRRPVHVQQSDLVEEGPLLADRPFPHLVRPAARVGPMDLPSYCDGARELLMARLRQHGAVLLRGFAVGGVAGFETALRRLFGELLDYSYRSTPRSLVASRIYTSTEYPADRAIPLHNEMSYTRSWPRKIGFFCMLPAEQGGATPIADSRGVLRRLSPQVRERFRAQGVLYVRNYGKHLDLPWQDVFQTGDPAEVERLCRHLGLDFTWGEDGRLRTRQVCQAVALHPDTGEEVWFNQAHLFHVSSLRGARRDAAGGGERGRSATQHLLRRRQRHRARGPGRDPRRLRRRDHRFPLAAGRRPAARQHADRPRPRALPRRAQGGGGHGGALAGRSRLRAGHATEDRQRLQALAPAAPPLGVAARRPWQRLSLAGGAAPRGAAGSRAPRHLAQRPGRPPRGAAHRVPPPSRHGPAAAGRRAGAAAAAPGLRPLGVAGAAAGARARGA